MKDHLLGSLRGDTAQILGRTRELDLHVDFRFLAVELLRFLERDLRRRVGDLGHDFLDGEQFELTRVLVEPGAQRLALVSLPRRRLERVLHRTDDDLRLDALFLGDRVDLLEQRIGRGCHRNPSYQLSAFSSHAQRPLADR